MCILIQIMSHCCFDLGSGISWSGFGVGRYHPRSDTRDMIKTTVCYSIVLAHFIIYLKPKIFIKMKFKFQIRSIIYYNEAIKLHVFFRSTKIIRCFFMCLAMQVLWDFVYKLSLFDVLKDKDCRLRWTLWAFSKAQNYSEF